MPLIMADTFIQNLRTFRVCWLKSRTGSGKTALAFRLAYALYEIGAVRYICSNCESVWCDDPGDVVLQNGQADVCLIMDEGGMFMESKHKAQKYLAFMRRLNIILLIPSVMMPATVVRFLTVKRTMNWGVAGIPLWMYQARLHDGEDVSRESFGWWRPEEIFGIYSTNGFPINDAGLSDWLFKWTKEAAALKGVELDAPLYAGGASSFVVDNGESAIVEELRGVVAAVEESSAANADLISLLGRRRNK